MITVREALIDIIRNAERRGNADAYIGRIPLANARIALDTVESRFGDTGGSIYFTNDEWFVITLSCAYRYAELRRSLTVDTPKDTLDEMTALMKIRSDIIKVMDQNSRRQKIVALRYCNLCMWSVCLTGDGPEPSICPNCNAGLEGIRMPQ